MNPSSQRTINLSGDNNLSQKTVNAEYITPLGDSESQENIQGDAWASLYDFNFNFS
ncbi:hypothetical protein PIB30_043394 [Stylosanthes scabra]|uniref:Uncharacterized protein n=1 Tax=Stylosanthes scabra TaxID=79078 RepID=A0ABU6RG35_9FABA|nr:hypothetical protein [Stylosanthes scabra]